MNGELPKEYEAMFNAVEMDPPSDKFAGALETYRMAVTWLGGPAWPDSLLAQCLAWSWVAGFPECCALGPMNTPLVIASYRFCLRGSCKPDLVLLEKLVTPLTKQLQREGKKTLWVTKLMDRYKITGWEKIPYADCLNKLPSIK